MRRRKLTGLLLCAATMFLAADLVSAADVSFKRRKEDEKKFVAAVGDAVVKAAHGTAKKISMVNYKYTNPKANRTELAIKMDYHGAVTNKKYVADIVVKIDSTDKDAWEVLTIDYNDNNNVRHNRKKLDDLVKELNK